MSEMSKLFWCERQTHALFLTDPKPSYEIFLALVHQPGSKWEDLGDGTGPKGSLILSAAPHPPIYQSHQDNESPSNES